MEAPARHHTVCSVVPLQGPHNHGAWLPIQTFYCALQKLHFMLNNVPHQHHQPLPRCFPLLLPENLTVFWTLPPSLGHAPVRLKARGKASSRLYCQLQTLFLDPPAPLSSFLSLTSSQMLPPDTPAHFPWFTAVLLASAPSFSPTEARCSIPCPSLPFPLLHWGSCLKVICFTNFSTFNVCCSVSLWPLWSIPDFFLLFWIFTFLCLHSVLHCFSALVRKA